MTPKLPGLLVRYLQEKRCVVFVGAGLSAGAGLPTWGRLLELGIEELVRSLPEGESHQDELKSLVSRGKLLEVAEFCREKLGPAYHHFLTDKVRGDTAAIPETHRLLMQLPFSAWVTTNYDKLLERAYADVKKGGYPRTLTHKDTEQLGRLLFEGGSFILKAHGDIDRPETVVLTSHDYSEIIHANPAFNEAFSSLMLSKALFFVGYSLSDPDFRLLMDRQLTHFKGYVPERFALMMDVGPVERDVLWRTARIRVISYEKGKHEQVLQFLEDLKAAVFPEPVPVAPSVKQVNDAGPVAPPPQVIPTYLSSPVHPGPAWVKQPDRPPTAATVAPAPIPRPAGVHGGGSPSSGTPSPSPAFLMGMPSLDDELGDASEAVVVTAAEEQPVAPSSEGTEARPSVSTEPDVLALDRFVRGQVKFRLNRPGQEEAEGIAQASVNREVLLTLQRASGQGRGQGLPASLYADLTQTFERHTSRKVLDVLDASGAASQQPLVLRVPPRLARFSWELLPIQGQPMCLQRKLVRAPVGVPAKVRGVPRIRAAPRVLLVAGPGTAERELERIARQYQGARGFSCTVLQGSEATFARVMAELDAALPDLLHYTGEVGREDGELFLMLSGGVDLSEGTLRSVLSRGRLPFLVINAASSAFAPPALGWYATEGAPQRLPPPSSEVTVFEGREGFMDLATEVGVGAFVGTFDRPGVEPGAEFMALLHRDLIAGLPIADAVLRARREIHKRFPGDPTALQYVLSGDGGLQLWDSKREEGQG